MEVARVLLALELSVSAEVSDILKVVHPNEDDDNPDPIESNQQERQEQEGYWNLLCNWHAHLNRPPLMYVELDPFDDGNVCTDLELARKFVDAFDVPLLRVAYLDCDTFIFDLTSSDGFGEEIDQLIEKPYDNVIPPKETFHESLDRRLVNNGDTLRIDMYLCELQLPDIGSQVCCVLDYAKGLYEAVDGDSEHNTVDCVIVRMSNLDNIGDLYACSPMMSKIDTAYAYRGHHNLRSGSRSSRAENPTFGKGSSVVQNIGESDGDKRSLSQHCSLKIWIETPL
ncbi:hypothetical protein BDK51DRAFT_43435 [Blyttiomyces helicus]|uniref:Uncharacterized protein n=1 Tax=Blyttiomyces helicus TaxID=388810 RepID=A0A4V1IST0_9FUNG|nr:hypothetical protein BDK51DRAFT_43435 [Blyttiomyces helicus]|eukprot:RKO94627.1 hypothetical protein BDK51DRAFT_43435 [Blyttiomyces helicus]